MISIITNAGSTLGEVDNNIHAESTVYHTVNRNVISRKQIFPNTSTN